MLKFGVPHPMHSAEVKAKIKLTNLKKYGSEHPNAWSSEKFRDRIFELHGVGTVRNIPGVHEKIRFAKQIQSAQLLKERVQELETAFGVQFLSEFPNEVTNIYDHELTWRHSCGRVYTSNITLRGLRQCPSCSSGSSIAEREIGDWIESHGFCLKRRDVKELGVEIDMLIPSKKLGIEYDGTYWHSAKFCSKEESLKKQVLAEKAGWQLITIQEHLWFFSKEKVLSRLASILGVNQTRIGARQTSAMEIDLGAANDFFKLSHLQGGARAQRACGLYYNEELIAAMSFAKPRFARKQAEWELIRFAAKPGVTISGGASKLLKIFRANHKGSILSYADRAWSMGNLYRELGFEFLRYSEPSYYWVSGKHGIFSRYQTQKKKLPKLFETLHLEFEPSCTEDENMLGSKFLKVYDRGNSVWFLK
jgi:hypothetical protein